MLKSVWRRRKRKKGGERRKINDCGENGRDRDLDNERDPWDEQRTKEGPPLNSFHGRS